jgi:hypothetical protein
MKGTVIVQLGQNLNQPPVRPTDVKTWLTVETMSPLGRALMEIATAIESSDDKPMDSDDVEREMLKRRGGRSENSE